MAVWAARSFGGVSLGLPVNFRDADDARSAPWDDFSGGVICGLIASRFWDLIPHAFLGSLKKRLLPAETGGSLARRFDKVL